MNLKLIKLDGRFDGWQWFSHRAEVLYGDGMRTDYITIRQWCWENFGPSSELKLFYWHPEPKPNWCFFYDRENRGYYIYLTEQARTHFALKWL